MLKQTSKNFKKYFLLEFTKELIRATNAYKILKIKKEVKEVIHEKPKEQIPLPRKYVRKVIKEKMKRDSKKISELKKEEKEPFVGFFKTAPKPLLRKPIPSMLPILRIPELRLPPTVQHLRPVLTTREIDLGKLNPLIRDPLVKEIECNGPDEKIIVMGNMGRKNTSMVLNEDEINDIIRKFSEITKIPVEIIFRVVFGRLVLSAIVSDVIGSKFIIRKMPAMPPVPIQIGGFKDY